MESLAFELPVLHTDCWNDIGIHGNGSCPELEEYGHCRNCPTYVAAGETLFERPAPEGYAQEWASRLADNGAYAQAREVHSVVVFRLGTEWYAIDVVSLVEVAEERPIQRVPHRCNDVLLGLANIRGELHICVNMAPLLGHSGRACGLEAGLADLPHQPRRLLVAEHQGARWVLQVDEVAGVVPVVVDEFRPVPHTLPGGSNSVARALFHWNLLTVGWIDSAVLFRQLSRSVG